MDKKVAIGSDHAGYDCKEKIREMLQKKGYEVKDFGTHSTDSVDYPDFAHPVASSVEKGEVPAGILVCGSGNGVAMAANKHKGIRAALCWGAEIAEMARKHNDANIVCIPARYISKDNAEKIVTVFLATAFEGGRHAARVDKIVLSGKS